MGDLICTCECGNKIRVPEYALGTMKKCAMCYKTFEVTGQNTIELDEPSHFISSKPLAALSEDDRSNLERGERCARCGRVLRGDWDKYSSDKGTVCHICADLLFSQAAPTQEDVAAPVPIVPLAIPEVLARPKEEPPPPRTGKATPQDRFEEFKQTAGFRAGLYLAAFGVIGIAIYFSFFHDFPEEAAPRSQQETVVESARTTSRLGLGLLGPPKELTRGRGKALALAVLGLKLLFAFLPRFVAIYITLAWADAMPSNRWWGNLIHVTIVSLITSMVAWFLIFAGGLIALYLLYEIYDLRFLDIVKFVVLNIILSLTTAPLASLVYGAMGLVAF